MRDFKGVEVRLTHVYAQHVHANTHDFRVYYHICRNVKNTSKTIIVQITKNLLAYYETFRGGWGKGIAYICMYISYIHVNTHNVSV